MTSKHTPGPWTVYPRKGGYQPAVQRGKEGGFVAAPELLDELEMLCNVLDGSGVELPVEVESRISFARAAIAKATGEQG